LKKKRKRGFLEKKDQNAMNFREKNKCQIRREKNIISNRKKKKKRKHNQEKGLEENRPHEIFQEEKKEEGPQLGYILPVSTRKKAGRKRKGKSLIARFLRNRKEKKGGKTYPTSE